MKYGLVGWGSMLFCGDFVGLDMDLWGKLDLEVGGLVWMGMEEGMRYWVLIMFVVEMVFSFLFLILWAKTINSLVIVFGSVIMVMLLKVPDSVML